MSRVPLVALLAACAGEGDYEVRWTVGADEALLGCPRSGLDTVIIDWVDSESGLCAGEVVDSSEHACRAGVARGFVTAGTYTLCIEAISPDRARLTGAIPVPGVVIRDGDLTTLDDPPVPLPVVPQCGNGLDDEPDGGDGRIDDWDPQCSDDLDDAE